MSFSSNTYLKVIAYLNTTIAEAPKVQTALAAAEAVPEIEQEVTEILSQIASLEGRLLAENSSPNSAMIRADVVEWSRGDRTKGMNIALSMLKQRLANLLGLNYNPSSKGCGTTSIKTRTIY